MKKEIGLSGVAVLLAVCLAGCSTGGQAAATAETAAQDPSAETVAATPEPVVYTGPLYEVTATRLDGSAQAPHFDEIYPGKSRESASITAVWSCGKTTARTTPWWRASRNTRTLAVRRANMCSRTPTATKFRWPRTTTIWNFWRAITGIGSFPAGRFPKQRWPCMTKICSGSPPPWGMRR